MTGACTLVGDWYIRPIMLAWTLQRGGNVGFPAPATSENVVQRTRKE